ncbi:MAG: SRPBCC family protein [Cyclobacteriaceae bacterium]
MKKLETLAKEGKINENASIKDGHSIIINAPINKVWGVLTDLEKWPNWNPVIKNVSTGGKPEKGMNFKWTFDGTKYSSQIQAIKEPETLAWTGKSSWIKSIHVWQLESDDNQTIASLSTSLQSTFAVLVNKHQKVYNDLIGWLECLKNTAESN